MKFRQKEKREISCSSSITSTGSDPKDLDGVILSFSSSPLPSPVLPLQPSTGPTGRAGFFGAATEGAKAPQASNALPALALAASGRLVMQPTVSAGDKENVRSPAEPRAPQLLTPVSSSIQPYRYSYPSQPANGTSSTGHPSSSGASADAPHSTLNVFVHRPHNSSIIAAKKHVRKRPLGSHAPLARTPSLPHSFAFPPSPPRSVQPPSARPGLQRSASYSLNTVAVREQRKSAAGLFANSQGETVACAADRRRSTSASPTGGVSQGLGPARPVDESQSLTRQQLAAVKAAVPVPMAMMTPVSKARARDELLQHMQSDPPTTSSPGPIPLTRRRVEALERSHAVKAGEESDDEHLAPLSRMMTAPVRPQVARSVSSPNTRVGGLPTLSAFGPSTELRGTARSMLQTPAHARSVSVPARPAADVVAVGSSSPAPTAFGPSAMQAGADLGNCAVKVLGRKRARLLEEQSGTAKSGVSFGTQAQALGLTSGGRGLGLTIDVARAVGTADAKRRRISGESAASSVGTDESSLGDLSYSSTSTASTVDSLTTLVDGDYFALPAQARTSRARDEPLSAKSAEDEQRECAELLLGLGGFH